MQVDEPSVTIRKTPRLLRITMSIPLHRLSVGLEEFCEAEDVFDLSMHHLLSEDLIEDLSNTNIAMFSRGSFSEDFVCHAAYFSNLYELVQDSPVKSYSLFDEAAGIIDSYSSQDGTIFRLSADFDVSLHVTDAPLYLKDKELLIYIKRSGEASSAILIASDDGISDSEADRVAQLIDLVSPHIARCSRTKNRIRKYL